MIKYVHTNIIAKDWRTLADFYIKVFECTPIQAERDLSGEWLDQATDRLFFIPKILIYLSVHLCFKNLNKFLTLS